MSDTTSTQAAMVHAAVDPAGTFLEASVDFAASPERVFRAISTSEITDWWVRPGVFDTRELTGDLRPGGRWRATGMSRGQPYVAEGDVLEVQSPRRFVHTWDGVGAPGTPSTLTYIVQPRGAGARLRLRQEGFASARVCAEFAAGWETSFARLAELLAADSAEISG